MVSLTLAEHQERITVLIITAVHLMIIHMIMMIRIHTLSISQRPVLNITEQAAVI